MVNDIQEALQDFKKKTSLIMIQAEYKNEMRFCRHMMENYNDQNYYAFTFRLETRDHISIRLANGETYTFYPRGTYKLNTEGGGCRANPLTKNSSKSEFL